MRPSDFYVILAAALLVALDICQAFHVALPPTYLRLSSDSQTTTALQMAKKRRRKRQENADDLPEFDLEDDDTEEAPRRSGSL